MHHVGVTQPSDDQEPAPAPPPQPFTMPGQAPPYGPPAGQAPPYGQAYGAYQPYPGASYGGTANRTARDPALAEWWQRLVARIIDGIILFILIGPFWFPAVLSLVHRVERLASQYPDLSQPAQQQAFSNSVNQMTTGMIGTFLLIAAGAAAISFGYDWLQHGLWGQTIGKRVMGTKVVTADAHARISGGAACGRAAVYALIPAVPSVGGIFGLLNELWLLWDPQRQCLHDKAAHTVVIKTSALAVPADGGLAAQPNSSV